MPKNLFLDSLIQYPHVTSDVRPCTWCDDTSIGLLEFCLSRAGPTGYVAKGLLTLKEINRSKGWLALTGEAVGGPQIHFFFWVYVRLYDNDYTRVREMKHTFLYPTSFTIQSFYLEALEVLS